MFKPALAKGEIQCIGATTLNEYKQHIEKDGALSRRFQNILVEPPSQKETLQILNQIKVIYENHHNVIYTPEAIKACITLTERYITSRHFPDKAIDALDEAGSRIHIKNLKVPQQIIELENNLQALSLEKAKAVKNQKYEEAANLRDKEKHLKDEIFYAQELWRQKLKEHKSLVKEEDIFEVISMISGVPIYKKALEEKKKFIELEKNLNQKIIGQEIATKKVAKAILRNQAGIKDPNSPIGSFIFVGESGIGKTKLAKVLSKELFGSEENLIRIDMSQYIEKFSSSRLIGSPPGYIGYEEGGQLTELVKRKPYCVILFDEIEKAHPDIFNLLLQILDEGQIEDNSGRKIDFKNTLIILTSNIGTRQISEFGMGVGFQVENDPFKVNELHHLTIDKELKKKFSPEFLNRIDEIIMFNSLEIKHIEKILEIELENLFSRLEKIGYKLKLTSKAKKFLVEKGFNKKNGARLLKRVLQEFVEDPIAEFMIKTSSKKKVNKDFVYLKLDQNKDSLEVYLEENKSEVSTS
jgi:ATP-dependent Clp protease ATP-binding subunit ClpC